MNIPALFDRKDLINFLNYVSHLFFKLFLIDILHDDENLVLKII